MGIICAEFAPHYFSTRYKNEWGDALNFDGEHSGPVREFFIANAGYWIDEFHLDGLRLDATQQIFDASPKHILAGNRGSACARRRAGAAPTSWGKTSRRTRGCVRPIEEGGYGLDALWNDDFHHSAIVAMTGRNEAYYTDYRGSPQEFISAAKWGFLFQGQRYKWQKKRRGTPSLDLHPANFVTFLQNHDQVANSLWGRRMHTLTSQAAVRALTALLLLGPDTPMLFQGQEFAASAPFLYFADHNPELAKLVAKGREEFLKQFPSIASRRRGDDPEPGTRGAPSCAANSTSPIANSAEVSTICTAICSVCAASTRFSARRRRGSLDGAVLGDAAFVLRFFGKRG